MSPLIHIRMLARVYMYGHTHEGRFAMENMTQADILNVIRSASDGSDYWGETMMAWFAVSDAIIWGHGAETPAHWEHTPGLHPDADNLVYQEIKDAPLAALIAAGETLRFQASTLASMGEDY